MRAAVIVIAIVSLVFWLASHSPGPAPSLPSQESNSEAAPPKKSNFVARIMVLGDGGKPTGAVAVEARFVDPLLASVLTKNSHNTEATSFPDRKFLTDDKGVAYLSGLAPGQWHLVAKSKASIGFDTIDIPEPGSGFEKYLAGRAARGKIQRLWLSPSRRFEVRVKDEEGKPVAGAIIVALDPDSTMRPPWHYGEFNAEELNRGLTDLQGRVVFAVSKDRPGGILDAKRLRIVALRFGGANVATTTEVGSQDAMIELVMPATVQVEFRLKSKAETVAKPTVLLWSVGTMSPAGRTYNAYGQNDWSLASALDAVAWSWMIALPANGISVTAFAPGSTITSVTHVEGVGDYTETHRIGRNPSQYAFLATESSIEDRVIVETLAAGGRWPDDSDLIDALQPIPILIAGKIVDYEGNPLPRASLKVVVNGGKSFEFNARQNGKFELRQPIRIFNTFSIEASQHYRSHKVEFKPGIQDQIIEALPEGFLVGRVLPVRAHIGRTLGVSYADEKTRPWQPVSLDEYGNFHVGELLAGNYTVRVWLDGVLVAETTGITVEAGRTARLPGLKVGGDLKTVEVRVVDQGGKGLEGARVSPKASNSKSPWFSLRSVDTDSAGVARILIQDGEKLRLRIEGPEQATKGERGFVTRMIEAPLFPQTVKLKRTAKLKILFSRILPENPQGDWVVHVALDSDPLFAPQAIAKISPYRRSVTMDSEDKEDQRWVILVGVSQGGKEPRFVRAATFAGPILVNRTIRINVTKDMRRSLERLAARN